MFLLVLFCDFRQMSQLYWDFCSFWEISAYGAVWFFWSFSYKVSKFYQLAHKSPFSGPLLFSKCAHRTEKQWANWLHLHHCHPMWQLCGGGLTLFSCYFLFYTTNKCAESFSYAALTLNTLVHLGFFVADLEDIVNQEWGLVNKSQRVDFYQLVIAN